MKRLFLAATLSLHAVPVLAECPDAESRLAFVERALDRDARATRMWRYGWIPVLAGGVGANSYIAATESTEALRMNAAATAAQITIPLSLTILDRSPVLRRTASADGDLCRKLELAENDLAEAARFEAKRRAPLAHLPPIAGNLATAAALSLYYEDNVEQAALRAAIGITMAELWIWTRPSIAKRAHASYETGSYEKANDRVVLTMMPTSAHLTVEF